MSTSLQMMWGPNYTATTRKLANCRNVGFNS